MSAIILGVLVVIPAEMNAYGEPQALTAAGNLTAASTGVVAGAAITGSDSVDRPASATVPCTPANPDSAKQS